MGALRRRRRRQAGVGSLGVVQVRRRLHQAGRRVADLALPLLRGGPRAVQPGLDLLRQGQPGEPRLATGLVRRRRRPGLPPAGRRADLDDGLLPLRERQGAGAGARAAPALRPVRGHLPLMSDTVSAAAPVEAPPRRPAVLLAVACGTSFVCVLDTSIVNVALPPMQESLALTP